MSLPPGWRLCERCGLPLHPANRGYRLHPCCDPGGAERWCPHCRSGPAGCDPARHPRPAPAGVIMCGRGGRRLAREDLAGGDRAAADDFTQYLARLRGQREGDADVRMRP